MAVIFTETFTGSNGSALGTYVDSDLVNRSTSNTFAQIASWEERQVRELSNRLAFKDRSYFFVLDSTTALDSDMSMTRQRAWLKRALLVL